MVISMSVSKPTDMGSVKSMEVFLTPKISTVTQSFGDMPWSCLG